MKKLIGAISEIESKAVPIPVVYERRAHVRREFSVPVEISVANLSDIGKGKSVDISPGGMYMRTQLLPPLGMLIDVQLRRDSGELLLHAKARVVRHEQRLSETGIGLAFENLSYCGSELEALLNSC